MVLEEEGDEAAQWPCLRQRCLPRWRATLGTSPASSSSGCAGHRVVVFAPTPFALEMELDPPQTLRLHMRGCGNGDMRVDVDFPAPHVIYLRRGWKTFARIHSLTVGLVLYFKLMEGGLLSVKVFGD